jgi:thioredoxin reductase (NADPH)
MPSDPTGSGSGAAGDDGGTIGDGGEPGAASDAAGTAGEGAGGGPAAAYDTVVVGGGPAGLAAALHLAWHRRRVAVIDRITGPLFFTLEALHNVPGMQALSGAQIQKALRAQAREMGAELVRGNVVRAAGAEGDFRLTGAGGEQWRARTLLLATGVARYHPTVDGDFTPCLAYAGKGTMFYCADCEAPEVAGKDTVVIAVGSAEAGAALALGLTRYTRRLRLLLTGGADLPAHRAHQLAAAGIPVVSGAIHRLRGDKRDLHAIELADGTTLEAQAFFVSSPARGRTDLARQLGVEMDPNGEHAVPRSPRGDTNLPGVWVAGDLRPITQQVAIAMGTGNIAAVMIDQQLRRNAG